MSNNDWQDMQRREREYQERQAGKHPTPIKLHYGPTSDYSTFVDRPGCITVYVVLLVMGVVSGLYAMLEIWTDYLRNDYGCTSGSLFERDCGSYREMASELIGVPVPALMVFALFLIGLTGFAIPHLWRMKRSGWWAIIILHSLNILAVFLIKTRVAIPQLLVSAVVLFWFWRNQDRFE